MTRATHRHYPLLWLASPLLATLSWAAASVGLTGWLWHHAPALDDRPDL